MKTAIPRYGARHIPGSTQAAFEAIKSGRGVEGPEIVEFERRFAQYHGVNHAVSASYGRMAFYYILKALDFPPGSEIIFPALTFWVVPEMARLCGLRPVFVDIDPQTLNLDPEHVKSAITPRTVAIVPTHLYGLPCEMNSLLSVARQHRLKVIEDCAHSLGASYQGQLTGRFGDAAFFSFQLLKGLNAYGGGMAITSNDALGRRIRAIAEAEPWPSVDEVRKRIQFGELIRAMISPKGFTFGLFIGFYVGSFAGGGDLSRFLWEKIRPLNPLPQSYKRRFSNAQAVVAMQGLDNLESLNARSRANAARLAMGLSGIPSIATPQPLPGSVPVYYQFCIRASDPQKLSKHAIRRGIDMEIMHVDICNTLPIFSELWTRCPVAESTDQTLQLPVYSRLQPEDIDRILRVVRESAVDLPVLSHQHDPASGRTQSQEHPV